MNSQHDPLRTLRRIADACFPPPSTAFTSGLADFQRDAVDRIRLLLASRHGAILADSVGLGKTHIAVSLIRMEAAAGGSTLVTAPSALRSHWNRHLRGIPRWSWLSHASLSRMSQRPRHHSLVVVDEAHALRNPGTRRYHSLALACEHARVLLITATPVNNSIDDFYHLIRLFAADDLFADIGVPDLRSAIDTASETGRIAPLQRVTSAIMVRRTRSSLTSGRAFGAPDTSHTHGEPSPPLRFPAPHSIETISYDTDPTFARAIRDTIPALHFPAHAATGNHTSAELMRLALLKRLESGIHAFRTSITRHVRLLDCFIRAADAGLLFDASTHHSLAHGVDGALQLALDSLVLPPWPPDLDRPTLVSAAENDRIRLRELADIMPDDPAHDAKTARLHSLLDELEGQRIILFTEFRDTAIAIWRSLASRAGVALIHGGQAFLGRRPASRHAIIERFAPLANGVRAPRSVEQVSLLIATDVLAEGLNLQDARVIISFDLPWNPIRLAQRIGRIDRLGSPHHEIRVLAFTPGHALDDMLRLRSHIRRKLRHIRIVGGDAPAFRTPSRKLTSHIDRSAHALEQARTALTPLHAPLEERAATSADETAATDDDFRDDERSCATLAVDARFAGSICCFMSVRGTPLIVYQRPGRRSAINTPDAWLALAHAAAAPAAPIATCARTGDIDAIVVAARASLARTARLHTHRAPRPTDRAGRSAAASVMRWLATRPGGPSRHDIDSADSLLLRLGSNQRAGAQLSLPARADTPSHDAIATLLRRPARPRTPAASAAPSDNPATERSFGSAGATLVGVLILTPRTT